MDKLDARYDKVLFTIKEINNFRKSRDLPPINETPNGFVAMQATVQEMVKASSKKCYHDPGPMLHIDDGCPDEYP